ncbi:MAG TPA: CoA pyrophosphatase [Candidatus Limnocylindrales bacterium]|jgi:8-oxo-dGTP pyrophosphatase MutT (NUDIX family)|nr:CoA pyrophosphatase [Candidatus Limnocylindrales bacterium]
MRFADAVDRLAVLPSPLPAGRSDLQPVFTDGRLRPRLTPTTTARAAAVLVLVFPDADGEARLVLTERMSYDGLHSGEVSFPGGKAEPGDSDAAATALREAAEEVGLDTAAARVRVMGALDEVFIPVSDFRITPIVAVAERAPSLLPHPDEVARILLPTVSVFLPTAEIEIVERTIGDWPIRYGGFRVDGLHVWGATARILGQLGAVLQPQ